MIRCCALALVGLLVTACSAFGRPAAVTVNGTTISQRSVDGELNELRDNFRYRRAVFEGQTGQHGTADVEGAGRGTVKASFAAEVLTRRVYFELIHQEVVRRRLRVGPDELRRAQVDVLEQVASIDPEDEGITDPAAEERSIIDQFSERYQDDLTRREAEYLVLLDRLGGADVTDAAASRYYLEHGSEFDQACFKHVLVASAQEAGAVRAELAGGADLGQVALARSKDPNVGQNAGDLGCVLAGSPVPKFLEAVRHLPAGTLSQPVHTELGWHVFEVYAGRRAPLASVLPDVRERLRARNNALVARFLQRLASGADIDVNPKYGRFDRDESRVVPP